MSLGSLDFGAPPGGTLAFGAGGSSGPPPVDLHVDGDIGALECGITLGRGHALGVDCDIGALDCALALLWDANVSRGYKYLARSHWQDARPVAAGAAVAWQQSSAALRPLASHWQDGRPSHHAAASAWQDSAHRRAVLASHWQDASALRHATASAWQQSVRRRAALSTHWQDGRAVRHAAAHAWQEMERLRHVRAAHWQDAAPLRRIWHEDGRDATPARHLASAHWRDARKPPPGRSWHTIPPQPPHLCYDPAELGTLQFGHDGSGLGVLAFWCRHDTPPPAGIVVPIRRVYLVINEIDLRRIDGNLPLPAYTLALSLDADSWTWQWSATLHKSALALLAPAQAGTPVEVQATVNGVHYRLLVESVRRAREFASTRVEVSGRGLAALLDAPYAPALSFGNTAQVNAEQLMGQVLTLNGVDIGWNLDFGLVDWLIPAGVFSHQGTWISAINTIAQAAGGYVQPHPTARTLRILHRYPVAPWDWGSVTPDIELPQDPVQIEGVEWVTRPDYNRVFVSGEGAGVLADIKRAGTAGDIEAPLIVDPLITDADVARQRGRAILSDTGPQAVVTLTLQVLPETGLILPGTFIRRTDAAAGEVLQGIVRSMSLAWDAPRMRQTLEVQTHA